MGVYINGMEMPTSCERCGFLKVIYEPPICGLTETKVLGHGNARLNNCPLVPVPPHGDLIDRDPFIDFIKSHWDSYDQWFVEQLEARPTIIPAEEE